MPGPSEPPPLMAQEPEPGEAQTAMSAEAVRAVLEAELKLQEGDAPGGIQLLREAVLFDPASAYLHVRLAEAQLDAGDAEKAAIAARAALALDPRSVPALRIVGAAQVLTGETQAARRSFERALEIAPADRVTSTALTELLVEQGDVTGAERVVERLMDAEPGAVDGYVALGRIFAERGDVERAFRHLEKAIAREPLDSDALELELNLLEALGRFEEAARAAQALARALGDTPAVRAELLSTLSLAGRVKEADAMAAAWLADDDSEAMRVLVADAFERVGEAERALAALREPKGARALLLRAHLYAITGDDKRASADACKAAESASEADADTQDVTAAACARSLVRIDKGKAAVALLLHALDDRPASGRLLDALVSVTRRPIDGVDAPHVLGRVDRALAARPADAEVVEAAARRRELAGDLDAARAIFDDALRARPSDPELLFALARFLDRRGQSAAATEIVLRLVDRGRRDVDTLNFIAFSLAESRTRPEEARAHAWRALVLDPLNGYVVDTLGWALFAAGDLEGARAALVRADRLSPREGEILFHLASVDEARGQPATALEIATRARALVDEDDPIRARVDALLARLQAKS